MSNPRYLSDKEVTMLLDQLKKGWKGNTTEKKRTRNFLLALFMLDAGLRVGECCHLKISHVTIGRQINDFVIITPDIAKRAKGRAIPLTTRLKQVIISHTASMLAVRQPGDDPYLFASYRTGQPLTTRQAERIIWRAGMEAFGHDIHPHTLRHTFATLMMGRCNIRIVQELLGHEHISSTQVYTHPTLADMVKAVMGHETQNTEATQTKL